MSPELKLPSVRFHCPPEVIISLPRISLSLVTELVTLPCSASVAQPIGDRIGDAVYLGPQFADVCQYGAGRGFAPDFMVLSEHFEFYTVRM
jgi:hypothetical protein